MEITEDRRSYQALFEDAPVGYLHLDRDGVVLEANAEAASILGLPKKDVTGRELGSFMDDEDAERFDAHRKELLAGGGPLQCELHLDAADGRRIPVRMDGTAVDGDPEGEIRCRCVLTNLSELKDAQAALQESEQRLRDIAERIEAVLYIHDEHGTISYVNPNYEKIWGRKSAELYREGHSWLDAVHPDDAPKVQRAFEALLAGADFDEEYRIVRPDGEVRWVLDRASPLRVDTATSQIGGLVYDITERRRAEATLRHAQKMEAIGTLASGIAHDFNNVLQAILGSADAASRVSLSRAQREAHLARIRAVAKRGGGLARRLLVFGRAHEPQLESVPIDDAVMSSSDLLRRLTGEHIDVAFHLGAPAGVILIDPVELEHVLLNLVSNARDAMPTGGSLSIQTEITQLSLEEAGRHHPLASPGEYVRLAVEDSGVGMDEATRARVFEPFFTTKDAGKGTGLGLSTVFAIVSRSGGHIDIQTQKGEGTRVALCFPRSDQPTRSAIKRTVPQRALQGTVLLVEDDPDIRASLRDWLEDLGLRVLAADGFATALKIRDRGEPIDIVITDVRMPKMQGPALVAEVKAAHPDARVLYVSADAKPELIEMGILGPKDPHLQKPFDREDLGARVEALCSQIFDKEWASRHTVAIVEDNTNARLALRDLLIDRGYQVLAFARPSEALDVARESPRRISVLVTDLCLPEMEGSELVRRLRLAEPSLPVVFMSGRADAPPIDDASYLQKPIDIDELADSIQAALR